jgi:uncharacterized protein (UPF0335 family)
MSFLETVAAPIRPASVVLRPAAAVLRPVLLPRLLVEAAADVRSIAVSTRELTVAVNQLADINERVGALEDEVTKMRQAVDAIAADMTHVRDSTEPLRRLAGRRARRRAKSAEAL